MTSYCLQLKSGKYWINDISGNIKAVLLKLSIINVHHKRNKMTHLVLLPWQQFCRWWCVNENKYFKFCLQQKPYTLPNLMMEVRTIWELCSFQVGPSVSLHRLQMGIFRFFGRKRQRAKIVAMATALRESFCFFCDTFMMPSFKNTASIYPEISLIQYFPLFSCKQYDVITDLICKIEKWPYL